MACFAQAPDFIDRETKAQGGNVTCPKPTGDFVAVPSILVLIPSALGP